MRASEVARLVGGTFEGGHDPELTGVAPLERAGPEELTFLASPKYLPYLADCRAGALLVAAELAERGRTAMPRIVVRDVHKALALVLGALYPERRPAPGIHPTAVLAHSAVIDPACTIGPHVTVGERSVV